MKWYVYLLRCDDSSVYCGATNRLRDRVATHNAGKGAKYTRGRLPVTLVYREIFKDKSQALKREVQIKKMSRKEKWKLITEEDQARELDVIIVCDEWRYCFYPEGWSWGHFASEQMARTAGEEHIARAIKYNNDFGLPPDELEGLDMSEVI